MEKDEMLQELWEGLNGTPRSIPSKYFYDAAGDAIFQEIMACPEYYLTRCEQEIFERQSAAIAAVVAEKLSDFEVVELGAGDATKSIFLLRALIPYCSNLAYHPIDFSGNVIEDLQARLPLLLPGLSVTGWNGEYFEMLGKLAQSANVSRLYLFLGSNIGNIPLAETPAFFSRLRASMRPGDLLLTGFDLKKNPETILDAYNDAAGITRRFNENLLVRFNRELGTDFQIASFAHQPVYDSETGACESYLVSLADQVVHFGEKGSIVFEKGERIFTEVSQKYSIAQTDAFAAATGFRVLAHFQDEKKWFLDSLWQVA